MRALIVPVLLLATAACSRSHAPSQAGSALPPPPGDTVAQSVPAGGAPAPAAASSGAAAAAAAPALAISAPRKDPRWQDVDPSTLEPVKDPALDELQAEQKKHDAELLAQDEAEANAPRMDEDQRGDDRYARSDDPYSRGDDQYARDEGQPYQEEEAPQDQSPYDEGDEPPPYDENDEPPPYEDDGDYGPESDPGYDPRDEYPNRPR